MKKGWHQLSEADEAEILRLHAAGKQQKEIASVLHIHRNSVYRTLRKFGLSLPWDGPRSPALTKAQKNQVLELLRKGMGTGLIARKLRLREHAVRMVSRENHFQHKLGRRGCRYTIPAETLQKLTDEIKARTNFGTDLAEKYPGISYRMLLKLAKKVLGCHAFRTGRWGEPLTSDYPQKHFRGEVGHG